MFAHVLTIIKMNARKVKPAVGNAKPVGASKVQFTEEQLTQLGNPDPKVRPSVQKAFINKYADKFQDFQRELESREMKKYQKDIAAMNEKNHEAQKFSNKQLPKHVAKSQRIQPQQMGLQQLSSVRLSPQYLPVSYMRQAQKIFNKYGQTKLRQIADNFSQLMKLRYSEQKINYDDYADLKFRRLEDKLPKQKQVEQIYLIGEQKVYDQKFREEMEKKASIRKADDDPIKPDLGYTQNIAISYLLNRAPRTFATAVRLMTEVKYKYPDFKPQSFIDFGGGLSAGSCAFIDVFDQTNEVYCVEPSAKMRKLSKYLTEGMNIQHFETMGQMASQVRRVDMIYVGYVLNELKAEYVEVYLQALYAKLKYDGMLVLSEYGSPFGARLVHEVRKWAIQKGMYIAAPCPHHHKCPLTKEKSWCHFDQPSGIYPSNIFGKLPTNQAVRLQKYSYLILQKKKTHTDDQQHDSEQYFKNQPNITKDWDRILFPVLKRGRHTIINLCTKSGKFQRRVSAKSHGPEYKEIKKLKWGDYWRFGKRIPNKFRKQRAVGKRLW